MKLIPHVIRVKNSLRLRDVDNLVSGWYDRERFTIFIVWNYENGHQLSVLLMIFHELVHHIINLFILASQRPKVMEKRGLESKLHIFWEFIWNPRGHGITLFLQSIGLNVEGGDFRFVLLDGVRLRKMFEVLNNYNNIARLRLSKNGLETRVVDPSNIAMVSLRIQKTSFQDFSLGGYDGIGFTEALVSLGDLVKSLKESEENDKVILERRDSRLKLTTWGRYKKAFEIHEFRETEEPLPEPDVAFDGRIKISTEILIRILEKLKTETETLKLVFNDQQFTIENGEEESPIKIEVSKNDEVILGCDGRAEAYYNSRWLLDGLRQLRKVCTEIILEFSTDMPLRIKVETPHHEILTFWLAPITVTD